MTTIHFVYPHGPNISCPDAIGRNLGKLLEKKYRVIYHDYDESQVIIPSPGDILLGHAAYVAQTCFRLSLSQPGWRRVIALFPYHHGNDVAVAFADSFMNRCDLYLAITGNFWYNSVKSSLFSHWFPKMVHVDLAIDKNDFPPIKTVFNPVGKRRFVFIGSPGWTKNPMYLSAIAKAIPEYSISWIGNGNPTDLPGLIHLGYQDFSSDEAKLLISEFDFMITVSDADANPATILESMAWGLIPVCTPQSGYIGYPGIVNVPLGNPKKVVEVIYQLQSLPNSTLQDMQLSNWNALDIHFNWDRFVEQVIQAIESNDCPSTEKISLFRKLRIRLAVFRRHFMKLRPNYLFFRIRARIRRYLT